MNYKAGDKPGLGAYKCIECEDIIVIEDPMDSLPGCSKCKKDDWEKLE